MKIGNGIYQQIEQFLIEIARLSQFKSNHKTSVEDINRELQFSRKEIKEILGYLDDKGYVKPETIGGKWLYGHVSITEAGLEKVKKID